MTTPLSLKNTPFNDFYKLAYEKTLSDEYCHKKLGTFKLKGTTAKNSTFNYKSNLALKSKSKGSEELALTDEYKIGFPYEKFYLQTKITRPGELELHLDGGQVKVWKDVNLYLTANGNLSNLNLSNFVYHLGANYFGEKCENSTKIEFAKGEHKLSNKTYVNLGALKYGYVGTLSLDNFLFSRYDAFLSYKINKIGLSLEHKSLKDPKSVQLGKGILGLNYELNSKTTLAAQLKRNFSLPKFRIVLGVQHQLDKSTVLKGKVDQKGKVTTAAKFKVKGVGVTLSTQFNFQNGAKFFDLEKKLPIPFGFTLDYEA